MGRGLGASATGRARLLGPAKPRRLAGWAIAGAVAWLAALEAQLVVDAELAVFFGETIEFRRVGQGTAGKGRRLWRPRRGAGVGRGLGWPVVEAEDEGLVLDGDAMRLLEGLGGAAGGVELDVAIANRVDVDVNEVDIRWLGIDDEELLVDEVVELCQSLALLGGVQEAAGDVLHFFGSDEHGFEGVEEVIVGGSGVLAVEVIGPASGLAGEDDGPLALESLI